LSAGLSLGKARSVADDDGARLPAVEFGEWLETFRSALRRRSDAAVPCAGCTACCRSSQFVLVEADKVATLARIPAAFRFAAPRRPRGDVVMGYDAQGHCPMLIDDRCSIYDARPRACRTFDCRVLTATRTDDPDHPLIAARAGEWGFTMCGPPDARTREQVSLIAAFLGAHRSDLPEGTVPSAAAARAALAIALLDHLGPSAAGTAAPGLPEFATALRELTAGAGRGADGAQTTVLSERDATA
jgi:hypothetical protein